MGLRFYFGSSDEEKSKTLYEDIIRKSKENPGQNFFVLVPDQFTMQTQKEFVNLHPDGGIRNIDVLSFGRLGYRIFEEVGKQEIPVLDDTGKSLVLQKVAAQLKEDLPVLGGFLHKQGYIHEIKSAISEFMQYGIGPGDMGKLIDFAGSRGALYYKLKDLATLYQGFSRYIEGHFVTAEETMDVLRRKLPESKLIKGSVIVLDGFTGFTPIQNRLIQELMVLSSETIVSLTMGEEENPYEKKGEQELFYLSKKTVSDLEKLAKEAGVERDAGQDVFVRNHPAKSREMAYLCQSLFRYGKKPYEEEPKDIHLLEMTNPKEEVYQTGLYIRKLIFEEGYAFRDIAVICGDPEGYAPFVEAEFDKLQIPCFIDRTTGILLNPMIEFIKSALELYLKDFSYEAVFHYLRSGLSGIEDQQIDLLENYCLQTGIRGYKAYSSLFTHKTAQMEGEEPLMLLNRTREQLMEQVSCLKGEKRSTAKNYVNLLYDFLVQNRVQQKLSDYEASFTAESDLVRAKEYAQIYPLVMELLTQIYELLGEEEISLQEFADILEAGFGEIEVGVIPQNVDRVLVGDMERTRLRSVKALFFMGVNDGNIPKSASKGGIISDMDREFLKDSGMELAPSPRQQMYIQRFYLYLNLHRPTDKLYLSYARVNNSGKSLRPAYLVETMKQMYGRLKVEYPQNRRIQDQIENPAAGLSYLAKAMREYVQGTLEEDSKQDFYTLYHACENTSEKPRVENIVKAAFYRYQGAPLQRAVAAAIYGSLLENSVTRLETYAACAYRHFLQYALSLKERKVLGFEAVDMGNIYHGILEAFAEKLAENQLTWFDFDEAFAKKAVDEALNAYAAVYADTVLYRNARNEYMITRMKRILVRTVRTLQKQLQKGVFIPEGYEIAFDRVKGLESVTVKLSEEENLRLIGRIDRVDISQEEEKLFVKVVDYKSGNRQFDLTALYYGLQLQLVVYLNAAMEMEQKKHPDKKIIPAAMLYYHIDDPTVESPVALSEEELEEKILEQLRNNGIVNSDPGVAELLDRNLAQKSLVIPVGKKKDGTFSAASTVMSGEELQLISDYVNLKLRKAGLEILSGNVEQNPYAKGSEQACTYCPYKKVCGFELSLPGCKMRKIPEYSKEELLQMMKEEL